jgi:hypothetical protein
MNPSTRVLTLLLLLSFLTYRSSELPAQEQGSVDPASPGAAQMSGCVTQVPGNPNALVLATGDRCLLLNGSYDPTKMLNHEVVLKGTLLEAAGLLPDRLQVLSTVHVGPACSLACTLAPPGTRGVHGGGRPTGVPSDESGLPRVTGTATLVSGATEPAGYGLYSYALLAHAPDGDELRIYRSFFEALVGLPTSNNLSKNLPRARINITEIPVTSAAHWDVMPVESRVSFVLDHYDYARSVAILGSLSKRTGTGPVIISVLAPIDLSKHPDPVLVEDLTKAEPRMMTVGVDNFVEQAGKDQFWDESKMVSLCFELRNNLEVAAVGMGMVRGEVTTWVMLLSQK